MALGMNADPRHDQVSAELVRSTGAREAVTVLLPDHDLTPWLDACGAVGVAVLPLVASESLPGWSPSWTAADYGAMAGVYAELYETRFDRLAVLNEPDLTSGSSSWTLDAVTCNTILGAFRVAFPRAMLYAGGLASGDPWWAMGLDPSLYDVLAIHAYGQRPPGPPELWAEMPGNFGSIDELTARYAGVAGKPIYIKEVGVTTTECSEDFQARYAAAIRDWTLRGGQVSGSAWFCAHDCMVPQFGLYRADGSPRPSCDAWRGEV